MDGWQGKILTVNLTDQTTKEMPLDETMAHLYLGGRGLGARLLWDMVAPGWDMVWVARPGINEAEFSELQSACARLLRRARLLRAPDRASDRVDDGT